MPRDINFNSGFAGCNDRMAILKSQVVPRRLKSDEDFEKLDDTSALVNDEAYLYVDKDNKNYKIDLLEILHPDHVNADWDEADPQNPAFILNKPNIGQFILQDDLTSLYNVGGIRAGDTFEAGTSVYDIIWRMLSIENDDYMFYGVCTNIPTITTEEFIKYDISRDALLNRGFIWENVELNNQYYVIVIPKFLHIKLKEVRNIGDVEFKLGFDKDLQFNGGTCNAYYYHIPATGTYSFKYIFEEGDEQ